MLPATNTLFPKKRAKRSSNRISRKFWNVPPIGNRVFHERRVVYRKISSSGRSDDVMAQIRGIAESNPMATSAA